MPNSITKNTQSMGMIQKMVSKAFDSLSAIEVKELTEGYFNVAYLIQLSNGRECILKIAPPKDVLVMTSEHNIMFSEVDSMNMISKIGNIPIAKILYYDNSHEICDNDYFFMEKLEGKSFYLVEKERTEEEKGEINYQLGSYNATLNKIVGKKFGYYGQLKKQGDNWYEVFKSMIEDCIHDANVLQVDIQVNVNQISYLLEKDKDNFCEVTIPKFVHWDLWAGNIFVKDNKITGLIDFERCMWADELIEYGFRTYLYDKNFFRGYGIQELSENQKIRAMWYDIYLFLYISIEGYYRKYDTNDAYHWGTNMLKEWIKKIEERHLEIRERVVL
jgi:aminoglycoside phosphotransferase (APT) family kinase protein